MRSHKILKVANPHVHTQNTFHKELGISKVLAQVLANRGITNIKEAENFLNVKLEHLLDPYSFSDMHKAVGLVKKARQVIKVTVVAIRKIAVAVTRTLRRSGDDGNATFTHFAQKGGQSGATFGVNMSVCNRCCHV